MSVESSRDMTNKATDPAAGPGSTHESSEQPMTASLGRIFVAPEVLVTIVRQVSLSEPGVARLSGRASSRRSAARIQTATSDGVRVEIDEQNGVTVDLRVIVAAGVNMVEIAHTLQNVVTRAIEHMVDMKVRGVNVHIDDIDLANSDGATGPPNTPPPSPKGHRK